ncbi:MAG: hypothetical protein HC843_09630 [Sphingomonadales bacterium]|nr:hypothetical protein [Sphingomonadales bacterium]
MTGYKCPQILFALALLCACQPPQRPVTEGDAKGSFFEDMFGQRCTLEILFGSYAAGIDGKSYAAVKAVLESRKGDFSVKEQAWGREGEKAVCADTANMEAADAVEKEVAKNHCRQ